MFTKVLLFVALIALGKCQHKIDGGIVVSGTANIYAVSIQSEHKHICAGALLKAKFVITAASCITDYEAKSLEVRVGSLNYAANGNIYYVKRIACRGDYKPLGNVNDWTVLEIEGQYTTNLVMPITDISSATKLTAYGWGAITENNAMSNQLRSKVVTLIPESTCQVSLGSSMVGPNVFCTEGAACTGDLGGPLTSGARLQGIISWNRNCNGQPTVYTDIYQHKADIEKCLV